jgi:hypothetical protein
VVVLVLVLVLVLIENPSFSSFFFVEKNRVCDDGTPETVYGDEGGGGGAGNA